MATQSTRANCFWKSFNDYGARLVFLLPLPSTYLVAEDIVAP